MSGAASVRLMERGGKLIADYGSYALIDVDGSKLSSIPKDSYQLRDEYRQVLLNAGPIDALDATAARLREATLPATGRQLHLVQFAGAVKPEWYEQLRGTGVRIVEYIPHNAYLVYGDATQLTRLISYAKMAPEVQWDGPYLNDYKINPRVFTFERPDAYQVQVLEDPQDNADTLARAAAMDQKGQMIERRSIQYVNLVVHADRDTVLSLSRQPDVISIYPWLEPKKLDERANVIAAGQLTGNGPTGPGYLAWLTSRGFTQAQFDATLVGVDVSDDGLDTATTLPNHFGLYRLGDVTGQSRVRYARLEGNPGGTIEGCDGHGTLNSHIIMSYNDLSGSPHTDAAGFHYNLGIAPFARVGSSVVFNPSFTFPDYEDLQSRAYRDGMRVSSNSWGAAVGGAYNSDSQAYDALVRDAQPTGSAVPTAGNQGMIIVFAAGNSGSGANTVGSPATGKNVITAGAAENVHPFGAADQCGVTDSDANSGNDIVFFSSRGPCDDARIKPDLVAAGSHVSGGVYQAAGQRANPPANPAGQANSCFTANSVCAGPGTSNFWPLGQQWSTASSGTSHSTPLIAGAAVLARQWLINNTGNTPSATMVKAYLMNSARYMNGTGANDTLYSNNQGMGHLDIGRGFDGTARFYRDEDPADLFTATGQTRTFNVFAADQTKPFRVTLAWTDAPGSTAGNSFNNNLDLTVTVGGNTYRGNNFTGANSIPGGAANTRDNVESVHLPAGTTGAATITVTATNINSDGVPGNASPLDQDFALVAYNVCGTQGTPPTGVTAAVSGLNQIQIDWTASTGNTGYNIQRATTAGGPYTQVGSVADTVTTFTDSTVSGGTTYFYVVRGVNCGESANSNEASATATGDCRIPPVFAGATGATSAGTASCGVNVAWAAATPSCAGPITYSVYRSRNGSFTPGPTNLIASGVTGTSYADTANLVFPNAYHYVVRAVETSGSSTNVDTNTVRRSVVPGGPIAPAITYLDDLNANRPPNADSYWIPGNAALQKSGCHWQSTNTAWRFGGTNGATCPSSYANSIQTRMVLGGNGANGINGFVFPPASTGTMTFRHAWDFNDVVGTTFFDGAVLDYSTVGPTGPWTKILTTVSSTEPYITAGGYNGTIATFLDGACWTGLQALTNGSFLTTTVNVNALSGKTIWFAWRYRTDSSVVREGHYLDDIAINVSAPSACTANQGTPGPAVAYEVRLPTTSGAGAAVNLDINALDGAEQIATGYAGTANLTTSDAQATIPATATFTAGVANLSATFGTIGLQTVTAVDDTISTITGTGGTMVTPGAPARLRFSVQPTNATAGVAVAPAIKVQVTDTFGNLVPTATDSIALSIGANPGGGTLRGTLTQSAVAGVATFNDINIREAGVGYDLVAASGTLTSATSSAFNINPDVPAALRYTQQPSDIRAGDLFNPLVQLEILDQYSNRNTTGTWLVLIGFETNPSNGNLLGTTLVDSVNGLATFTDISVDRVGTGYSFTAIATFDQETSGTFSVSPNNPHHLTISTQPGDTTVNTPISPVTVAVRDRFENLATQSSAPITAALLGGAPGAVLGGTKTRNAVAGLATFDDLTVNRAGTAYTLRMGSTGLFSADTVGFDVAGGAPPVAVEFVNQPSNSAAGAAISPAITVRVVDASGNTVVDASDPVTLSMGANPGGGSLSGGLTSTPVNGVATFSTVSINKSGSGYTLVASSAALTSATSSPFDVAAGAAASLAFGTQPTNTRAGQPITPAVTVRALDAFGNLSAFSGAVTVTLSGGNPNASLGGTTTVNAAAGVATFSNLSVNKKGSNYTLTASASGLSGATSNPFNISSGPASKLVISGLGFSVTSYSDVLFTVTAYDDQDNLAEDYVGTAAITSNDTAAALPANATFVSGVAKDVKIVFKTTGVHTVTATDTTTSSLTATANLVVTNFPQPTVSITEPGNGTSVAIGSVSITATATVATGTTLSKLEIFVDGSSVSSGTTSPATASWDTSKMEKGTTHLIHAVASDAAGNVVQSTPLTVIITSEGGCGCTTGSGGADMALLAAVGAALRAIGFRRRRAAKK